MWIDSRYILCLHSFDFFSTSLIEVLIYSLGTYLRRILGLEIKGKLNVKIKSICFLRQSNVPKFTSVINLSEIKESKRDKKDYVININSAFFIQQLIGKQYKSVPLTIFS